MALLDRITKYQRAVVWQRLGTDEAGNPVFQSPVEIGCRWEDSTEVFLDEMGEEQVSNAKIYVDMDLKPTWLIRLGKLDTVIYFDDPHRNDGVYEIRKVMKLPNLRVTKFLRTVFV